jgi:hypothetical protein
VCEPPPRQWREFLSPGRILLGVTALLLMVAGIFFPILFPKPSAIGITLIGCAAVLLAAVIMPGVSQVEFGVPAGVKVISAVRDRGEKLRQVFEDQRPDFEVCAKLLCDDPAIANELLTAAMGRATSDWRGPIDREVREIRTYVLCLFVHRLMAYSRLGRMEQQPATTAAQKPRV